ncbi:uracil-DNA glycosylase [Roseibium suaedae]|uniref:Type-4 uracil-DNA glycosylase n=1 Tax=Roseibium suaedae TaxID=735517 RepID=A0A1M7B0E4_9HYPH|nr:uracil-DNA glycosylase [Roseibium suaedae]SHL48414.1 DNA polymerase [Roseibium suaedae]
MHNTELAQRELESLLDFLTAAGLDCFLEEEAVDSFALSEVATARRAMPGPGNSVQPPVQREPAAPAPAVLQRPHDGPLKDFSKSFQAQPEPAASSPMGEAVVPDKAAIDMAREAARAAGSLEELKASLGAFSACNLKLTAKSLVFADGRANARVMLIGGAPGRDEDAAGVPFIGRSGQLLNKMLAAIGLNRGDVYLANVVPWRPPGDRTPTPQETEICLPFIARQIELVTPDFLVLLGAASAKSLLGTQEAIRNLRGRWGVYEAGGRQLPCLTTYDPDFLLRSPLDKRLTWLDFLALRERLRG